MTDLEAQARLLPHARREALVVMIVWLLALAWTVGYCYLRGYQHPPDGWAVRAGLAAPRQAEDLGQVAGFPDWVFVGILLPWLVCTLFTIAFSLFGMRDDPLGGEAQEGAGDGP